MKDKDIIVNPADRKYTVLLLSVIDSLETMTEANMRTMVSTIAQVYASFPILSSSPAFPV